MNTGITGLFIGHYDDPVLFAGSSYGLLIQLIVCNNLYHIMLFFEVLIFINFVYLELVAMPHLSFCLYGLFTKIYSP